MPEKIKAKVNYAAFEYHGYFGDPILNNQRLLPVLQHLYEALKQWNIRPQDVKYKNAVAANDGSVFFELAGGRLVLAVSHAGFTVTVQNADWNQAEFVSQLIAGCWGAVTRALEIEAHHHELQIQMTVTPEGKSLQDITASFAAPWHLRSADTLEMCGVILYTADGVIVLDRAVANPQGIFAKIVHRFQGQTAFPQMAQQLYDDEAWLANTLGMEFE